MEKIDIPLLRNLFHYDSETGVLTHLKSVRHGEIAAGSVAGNLQTNGYRYVDVNGRKIPAHRVCFAIHYGVWPADMIDHINCVRDDNRIANLREASRSENMQNKALQRNNSSGAKGVTFFRPLGKWQARIGVDGVRKFLGYFDDVASASVAYKQAALRYHGDFARTN